MSETSFKPQHITALPSLYQSLSYWSMSPNELSLKITDALILRSPRWSTVSNWSVLGPHISAKAPQARFAAGWTSPSPPEKARWSSSARFFAAGRAHLPPSLGFPMNGGKEPKKTPKTTGWLSWSTSRTARRRRCTAAWLRAPRSRTPPSPYLSSTVRFATSWQPTPSRGWVVKRRELGIQTRVSA